jgi:hypothetical protein
MEEEIRELKEQHGELKKRINVNIELMFENTEKKH